MVFSRQNILLMLLGMVLNLGLFIICNILNLPIWMDMTGTVLVAMTGGFIPAAIVAVFNSILLCLKPGWQMFLFVLSSLAVAATVSECAKRAKRLVGLNICGIIFVGICVKTITTVIITLVIGADSIVNKYELICYNAYVAQGISIWLSITFSTFITSIPDGVGIATIVFCSYKLLYKFGFLKEKIIKKKLVLVYDSRYDNLNNVQQIHKSKVQ